MLICNVCSGVCREEDEEQGFSPEYGYYSKGCPNCGGELSEAVQCMECEEFFSTEDKEVYNGLCCSCINKLSDPKIMYKYIDEICEDKPGFVEWCFELPVTPTDILTNIIFEWYSMNRENGGKYIDLFEKEMLMYCTDDLDHYSNYLIKELNS